jgi:hypothetical protein
VRDGASGDAPGAPNRPFVEVALVEARRTWGTDESAQEGAAATPPAPVGPSSGQPN